MSTQAQPQRSQHSDFAGTYPVERLIESSGALSEAHAPPDSHAKELPFPHGQRGELFCNVIAQLTELRGPFNIHDNRQVRTELGVNAAPTTTSRYVPRQAPNSTQEHPIAVTFRATQFPYLT